MVADFASPAWLTAACFSTSWLVSGLALRYAHWRQLIDQPGERRSHATPTPRGGGIGIVAALLVAGVALAFRFPEMASFLTCVGAGLMLVAGIGWLDDHRPLSPWPRLGIHCIAATLLGIAVYLHCGQIGNALLAAATALVLVNIWNFMDGIDGIATLQAIVVAVFGMLLAAQDVTRWLSMAFVAACCGFLPFNFPRARFFLGDVGSGALGYALAVMAAAIALEDHAPRSAWWLLALPGSAFLVDASLTLLARFLRGERWWTPHVSHTYQRWARHLGRHVPVTLAFGAWAIVSGALMISLEDRALRFIIAAIIVWYLGGGILWRYLQHRFDVITPRI